MATTATAGVRSRRRTADQSNQDARHTQCTHSRESPIRPIRPIRTRVGIETTLTVSSAIAQTAPLLVDLALTVPRSPGLHVRPATVIGIDGIVMI